jgi:hypothetical protein
LVSLTNGSVNGSRPRSWSTFVMNLANSKWLAAYSLPPMYSSTGSHRRTTRGSNGPSE